MSSYQAIVDRIQSRMLTITDIGNVHNRKRAGRTEDEIRAISVAHLSDNIDHIRTWFISLGTVKTEFYDASGTQHWGREIEIEGFLELDDAASSELAGIALAEQITRVVGGDMRTTRLNGSILYASGPPHLSENKPVTFGFLIAHHIVLRATVDTIDD